MINRSYVPIARSILSSSSSLPGWQMNIDDRSTSTNCRSWWISSCSYTPVCLDKCSSCFVDWYSHDSTTVASWFAMIPLPYEIDLDQLWSNLNSTDFDYYSGYMTIDIANDINDWCTITWIERMNFMEIIVSWMLFSSTLYEKTNHRHMTKCVLLFDIRKNSIHSIVYIAIIDE
jgi:hypothetical protein